MHWIKQVKITYFLFDFEVHRFVVSVVLLEDKRKTHGSGEAAQGVLRLEIGHRLLLLLLPQQCLFRGGLSSESSIVGEVATACGAAA